MPTIVCKLGHKTEYTRQPPLNKDGKPVCPVCHLPAEFVGEQQEIPVTPAPKPAPEPEPEPEPVSEPETESKPAWKPQPNSDEGGND